MTEHRFNKLPNDMHLEPRHLTLSISQTELSHGQ